MKTILIAGANGFLARYLTRYFVSLGWEVIGLARHKQGVHHHCRYVHWDGKSLGAWARELDRCDVLINLAGRSVNCRYNEKNRQEIWDSRVQSTRVLGEAIAASSAPPGVWLNASTATIYRHAEDRPQSEQGEIGDGFSVNVAKAWEASFFQSPIPDGVRRVAMRTSLVLADEPGTVFCVLKSLARAGLGGKVGSGRQRVSWIHILDFCRAVHWLVDQPDLSGPINVTAPAPLSNAEVMQKFRALTGMVMGLPASIWMAEVGAWVLRTETELILKSRWVVPTRLLEHGFAFTYPEMDLKRWVRESSSFSADLEA